MSDSYLFMTNKPSSLLSTGPNRYELVRAGERFAYRRLTTQDRLLVQHGFLNPLHVDFFEELLAEVGPYGFSWLRSDRRDSGTAAVDDLLRQPPHPLQVNHLPVRPDQAYAINAASFHTA